MKRSLSKVCVMVLLGCISARTAYGQEEKTGYNPLSLYKVHESRIMFSKLLWWRVDLKEKQNQPFFSQQREISTLLIDAVKKGLIVPYENDSVLTRMPMEKFLDALKLPDEGGLTEQEKQLGFTDESTEDWGDDEPSGEGADEIAETDEFDPRDFSVMEIKESWFFDRMRSRMYHDILSITILLPAEKNPALYEKPIASFRYVDVAELFRSMPEEAIWYNYKNVAGHLNMTDAFELRLFKGILVKYSNPADNRIVDIYTKSRRDAIIASLQLEQQLTEFESQLWEY